MGSGVAPALWPPETLNSVVSRQLPVVSGGQRQAFADYWLLDASFKANPEERILRSF